MASVPEGRNQASPPCRSSSMHAPTFEQFTSARRNAQANGRTTNVSPPAEQKAAKRCADHSRVDMEAIDRRPPAPLPRAHTFSVKSTEPRPRSMSTGVRPRVVPRANRTSANNSLSLQGAHTLPTGSTFRSSPHARDSLVYDSVDSDIGSLSDPDSDVDRYTAGCAMMTKTSEAVRRVLGKSGSDGSSFSESGSLWSNATERQSLRNSDGGELLEAWEIYVSVATKHDKPDSDSDCSDEDDNDENVDDDEEEEEAVCSASSSESDDVVGEMDISSSAKIFRSGWGERGGRVLSGEAVQRESSKLERNNAVRRRLAKDEEDDEDEAIPTLVPGSGVIQAMCHRRRKMESPFNLAKVQ